MSIASEINRIKTNISEAYNIIREKGGTLPETQDSAHLSTTIEEMPSTEDLSAELNAQDQKIAELENIIDNVTNPALQDKTVAPTTSQQVISADNDYYGLDEVTVSAVTSAIDQNITAENIKKDVSILGVTGTYEGSSGGSEPNIFVQTTEPDIKKGIWLQKNATPDYYTYDEEVFVGGTWMADGTHANIPYNFYRGGAATIGTDVYLFGSYNSSYYRTAYKYNTLTNTYTQLTNIPYDFSYGGASAVGTDVYLFGGGSSSYRRRAYKYNTLTDTYTQLTDIPYDFRNGSTVSIGTNVYLLGSTDNLKYNYKYDTLTDTYTKLTNIPNDFYSGSAVAIGTGIFLFGGLGYNKLAYKYETSNDTYTQLTDIPYMFTSGGAVAIGTDAYLFGSGQTYFKNNYKYNTLTDTYTQLTDIPYNFYSGSAVPVGTDAYLFGGEANNTKVQVYNLESKTYSQDNLVVISQGKYSSVGYEIELFDTPKDVVSPKYAFADAWYYTTANSLETDIPTYYGNGTAWVKIKN